MTDRAKQALRNFAAGYNCAMSVAMAYADAAGLTPEQAGRAFSAFGGGIGRLRGNCGAFSAALMICGSLEANGDKPEGRPAVYAHARTIYDRFIQACGTISCAELLQRHPRSEGPTPEERTPAYYASRPCARVILQACRIIDEQLASTASFGDRCDD